MSPLVSSNFAATVFVEVVMEFNENSTPLTTFFITLVSLVKETPSRVNIELAAAIVCPPTSLILPFDGSYFNVETSDPLSSDVNCIALSTPLIDFTTRENVLVFVSIMLAVSPSDFVAVESFKAFIASRISAKVGEVVPLLVKFRDWSARLERLPSKVVESVHLPKFIPN